MDPIMATARQFGLRVIEDNAQGIGALYKGRPTGSFGDVASISFYPTKNLGACGDAGMIVTNDEQLANRIRSLRAHGMTRRYYHDELGVNSRLDELQAAVLRAKLPFLQEWTNRRNEIARRYTANLKNCPGITLPVVAVAGQSIDKGYSQAVETNELTHAWHQYTIRVHAAAYSTSSHASQTNARTHQPIGEFDPAQAPTTTNENRERLIKELNERGIGSMCYYPVPLHVQTAFSNLGYRQGDFPLAERAADEVLSLPMYPELTDQQVDLVCFAVKDAMSKITVSGRSSVAVHNTFPGI
jgi:dTDP-4-amino-4,6-dideoxygalactose transaminase